MSPPTYPFQDSQMASARDDRLQHIKRICSQRSSQMGSDFQRLPRTASSGPGSMTAAQSSAVKDQRRTMEESRRSQIVCLGKHPWVPISAEEAQVEAPSDSRRSISPLDLSSTSAPVPGSSTDLVQQAAIADIKKEFPLKDHGDRTIAPRREAIGAGPSACSTSLPLDAYGEAIQLGYDCLMEAEDQVPITEDAKIAANGYCWIVSFATY